jgi:hypothetical protein
MFHPGEGRKALRRLGLSPSFSLLSAQAQLLTSRIGEGGKS